MTGDPKRPTVRIDVNTTATADAVVEAIRKHVDMIDKRTRAVNAVRAFLHHAASPNASPEDREALVRWSAALSQLSEFDKDIK